MGQGSSAGNPQNFDAQGNLLATNMASRVSGRWYPTWNGTLGTTTALAQDTVRLFPFVLDKTIVIDELGVRINTLHAANNIQLAIYANDPLTNRPTGSELAATANIPTDAAVTISAAPVGGDVVLGPGIYWAAVNSSGSTAACQGIAQNTSFVGFIIGATDLSVLAPATTTQRVGFTTPLTFGTWGDLTAAVFTSFAASGIPLLFYKVA